jgi:AraC-like DNA-binding protein
MVADQDVKAWRPTVPGISEVLHARLTNHSYPMHTHDSWTLLIVDYGTIRYDLARQEHGAVARGVTLLPPHVPHNGCSVTPGGFRKRVVYLDTAEVGVEFGGAAVDQPVLDDPVLRQRIHRLHIALAYPADELEAESRLVFIVERLQQHLKRHVEPPPVLNDSPIAARLRDLLDERFVEGIALREAARVLYAHPTHLVRAFSREYGLGPHQYLTGRRIDLARRLLLDGLSLPAVASTAGFYDQSHLSRNFKRILGVSPARYARSGLVK